MTGHLTDAQRDARDLAREFTAGEIAPHAADWNARGHVPLDLLRRTVADAGPK